MPIIPIYLHHFFVLLIVVSSVFILITRQVVHAALALLVIILGIAGIYVLMHTEFLAIIQVMVHIGTVLLLILWGITLPLQDTIHTTKMVFVQQIFQMVWPIGLLSLLWFALVPINFEGLDWINTALPGRYGSTANEITKIGEALLGKYMFVFELTGIVLLLACIGAAYIVKK